MDRASGGCAWNGPGNGWLIQGTKEAVGVAAGDAKYIRSVTANCGTFVMPNPDLSYVGYEGEGGFEGQGHPAGYFNKLIEKNGVDASIPYYLTVNGETTTGEVGTGKGRYNFDGLGNGKYTVLFKNPDGSKYKFAAKIADTEANFENNADAVGSADNSQATAEVTFPYTGISGGQMRINAGLAEKGKSSDKEDTGTIAAEVTPATPAPGLAAERATSSRSSRP